MTTPRSREEEIEIGDEVVLFSDYYNGPRCTGIVTAISDYHIEMTQERRFSKLSTWVKLANVRKVRRDALTKKNPTDL